MIPVSLNFQNAGYNTTLFLITARSCIINIITLILLGVVNLILAAVRKFIPHRCLTKLINKIYSFIFFGAIHRLFLAAYVNVTLCSLLNIAHMEWMDGVASVNSSNVLCIIWISLCLIGPVLFGIYAFKHRADWGE